MLRQLRQSIIEALWDRYRTNCAQAMCVDAGLRQKNIPHFVLDHFAIIDLPHPQSGIPFLRELFEALGFVLRGEDYLPSKQNDFAWLAEASCETQLATETLPQVVVADFRLHEMPTDVRSIIEKFAAQTKPLSLEKIRKLIHLASQGDAAAACEAEKDIVDYLTRRDGALPTITEFKTVNAFNELLAWVLAFGRRPNHFTVSVHLLHQHFADLTQFNQFIEHELGLPLNCDGDVIKGGAAVGLAQSSTRGELKKVKLADGDVFVPTDFVEFVWRYPVAGKKQAVRWGDYFANFIAPQADHVIQSLYTGV